MKPESVHFEQKHRRPRTVVCVALIVSLIAALAALATVSKIRDHLCYEHHIYVVCSKVQIGESEMRVFAWHPEVKPLSSSSSIPNPYRAALTLSRILHDIPPYGKRPYASGFPSGTHQWLYWEARLTSHLPPSSPIRFVVHWTTYETSGNSVAGGVVEATWGADDPAVIIIGPADTYPIRTAGQFPPGHYTIVLKVYGNQLSESEVHGGYDID